VYRKEGAVKQTPSALSYTIYKLESDLIFNFPTEPSPQPVDAAVRRTGLGLFAALSGTAFNSARQATNNKNDSARAGKMRVDGLE
jgi:hypothetical protein